MWEQLEDKGLLKGMDEKQLKNKIKNLKDVFRQELAKIERSKKTLPSIQNISEEISNSQIEQRDDEKLNKIAENVSEGKPYDEFGKYVAAELRQLPQREAILLQQEIQNSITRVKLMCLGNDNQLNNYYREPLQVQTFSPLSSPSDPSPASSATYEANVQNDKDSVYGNDVIHQALLNTF
ncbi:unnamed protein product [Acanthoscelides obtectus]|uniref:Uncharacterized protein n=1 Tax=Acanthoscelides obtectus TaxID=200917 RepID=A0A9P0LFR1_ACAOB|nr:unnamed protein product [Acanthoscelides obtectus]CAK1664354.1 hypothetical protein AOBTE_LOCUS24215 [Acanthoscelides obtectus]